MNRPDVRHRWRSLARRRVLGVRGLGPVLLGVGVLALAFFVISIAAVIHTVRIDHQIQDLSDSVRTAQSQAEAGKLAIAEATLNRDERRFISIRESLSTSPDLRVLGLLPVARQNIDAVSSASALGLTLLDDARLIIGAAQVPGAPSGSLDLSLKGGRLPTQTVQRLRTEVGRILPTLPDSPAPPDRSLLIGTVSRARDKLWLEAYQRRSELITIDDALGVLNELTGGSGPRRYLVAVANTAEMRGAGGMILSYGVLNADDGHITLGDFGNIDRLLLKRPAAKTFPADYNAAFADYHSNLLWRNATIMSDFTVDAPVLESMYTDATGNQVDGVLQVDPAGLGAILAGIGPIQDPLLGTVTAANVVPLTLNTAYLAFPDRSQRKEFLAGVAKEAFAAMTSRPVINLRPLIDALGHAAAQRHLIMYSSTPGVEPLIAHLGAAGGMPGPGRAFDQLTVQNMGGNKLDFYVSSGVAITGTAPTATRPGNLSIIVEVSNGAPTNGKAGLVFGPYDPSSGDPPGVYHGLVTLYLPRGTLIHGVAVGARGAQGFENEQNGLVAFTYSIDLHAATANITTIRATIPPDPAAPGVFTVVPTPRINPTTTVVSLKPH